MRQFLIHAALKRADELNRLRELPDTPTRTEEPPPIVAGLSSDRSDADPGTITETPVVSIPIEIGEPSPVELPTAAPQASPKVDAPAVKKAEPAKPQRDAGRRVYRVRHTKVAAKPPQPRQYSFLEMFFWGQPYQQSTYSNKPQKSQLDQVYGLRPAAVSATRVRPAGRSSAVLLPGRRTSKPIPQLPALFPTSAPQNSRAQ